MTANATRAIIYIQADKDEENDIDIGLVAFIGVGLVEVSTCDVTVKKGQRIKKGDELGMFHFGGSTFAMIFRPNVTITFADHVKVDDHLRINSIIGQATK